MEGDAPPPARGRALEAAALGAALLPPAFLLVLVLALGVDTPYMDQWEVLPLAERAREGTLGWGDLWAQQNESRMVLPRLLWLGLGTLTDWDMRVEMLLPLAAACFVLGAMHRLDRGGSRAARLGRTALAGLLLLGPIGYENWFWGHQVVVWIPAAAAAGILLAARSGAAPRTKVAAYVLLSLAATLSFAGGALVWGVGLLPLLAALPAESFPRRRLLGIAGAATAATLLLYFAGYARPANQPGFGEAVARPLDAALYLLALLGSPLGQGIGHSGLAAAAVAGGILLLLAGGAAAFLLRGEGKEEVRDRALPFLVLAALAVATALLTTAGRAGFGPAHALSPRYAWTGALLAASLVHLLGIALPEAARRGCAGLTPVRAAAAAGVLGGAALLAHGLATDRAILRARNWRVRRLEGSAALAFHALVPHPQVLRTNVYPDADLLLPRAAAAGRAGLLRPAPLDGVGLARLLASPGEPAAGAFGEAVAAGGGIRCRGRALLPGPRAEPPDAILVGAENADGSFAPLELGFAGKRRVSSLEPPTADFTRLEEWEANVVDRPPPPGARVLRAFAYDARAGRLHPIPGTPAIPAR